MIERGRETERVDGWGGLGLEGENCVAIQTVGTYLTLPYILENIREI